MLSTSLAALLRNCALVGLLLFAARVALEMLVYLYQKASFNLDFSNEHPVLLWASIGIPALVIFGKWSRFPRAKKRPVQRPLSTRKGGGDPAKQIPSIVKPARLPVRPRNGFSISPALGELLEEGWAATEQERREATASTDAPAAGAFVTPEQHRARRDPNENAPP